MAQPSGKTLTVLAAGLIVVAGVLAYSDSFRGVYVYDDIPSILGNASIRDLGHLKAVLFPPGGAGFTHEGRPILNLSLALNYAAGGTRVWGYHAVNLAIHVLSALLVFGLVRRTAERCPPPGVFGPVPAAAMGAATALLWMLHPLQTESVTYLIQRAESLVGLFYLAAFYCFARYVFGGARVWAILCVAATWLGMGAKELMVTAPVMLFLFDRTFAAGSFANAWKSRKGLYLALASAWIPLVILVASNGGNRGGSSGFGTGMSWIGYALTQPEALCRYFWLSVYPSPLVFDYGPLQRSIFEAFPYGIVVLALGVGTLWALVKRPVLGFLGFWVFGILAITSLVQGSSEMIVERRMYLPLLAIAVLAVVGLWRLLGRWSWPVLALMAAVLGFMTWQRNIVYQSDLTVWKDSVDNYPHNSRAWYNLGVAYFERRDPQQEIASYLKALDIDANNIEAQHSLGNALVRMGHPIEALPHYEAALARQPKNAHLLADAAAALAELGRWTDAITQATLSVKLDPDEAKAHDTLGVCLMETGRGSAAAAEFRAAIKADPSLATAHANLGVLLASAGNLDEASVELLTAVKMNPALGRAEATLGNIFCQQGRFYEAVRAYEAALQNIPMTLDIEGNLGLALLETSDPDKALPLLQSVANAKPNSKQAHHNLAAAYSALGRNLEAQGQLSREASSSGQ